MIKNAKVKYYYNILFEFPRGRKRSGVVIVRQMKYNAFYVCVLSILLILSIVILTIFGIFQYNLIPICISNQSQPVMGNEGQCGMMRCHRWTFLIGYRHPTYSWPDKEVTRYISDSEPQALLNMLKDWECVHMFIHPERNGEPTDNDYVGAIVLAVFIILVISILLVGALGPMFAMRRRIVPLPAQQEISVAKSTVIDFSPEVTVET